MLNTITMMMNDATTIPFGMFGYVWAAMACFAGVMYVAASR